MLQDEVFFYCPYCGERISVVVDGSVCEQAYVEDCEVCCQPITITTRVDAAGARVEARRGDD